MKVKIVIILIILILVTVVYAADVKWSAVAENTTVADDDVMLLIDTGTGDSEKITVLNLFDTIDTSAELLAILTNETGTGALVFATSPTLVTPILGTITSGVGTALTALNGENIQDDTIDDDSIDFADVTGVDLTLTDCGAITSTGTITATVGFDIVGAADIDYGSVDVLDHTFITDGTGDGEIILPNDSIGDAEIDWSGLTTSADFTVTGTLIASVGIDGVGAVDLDYGSVDITDHTFVTDGTGTAEIVLPAGSIDSTEILDATVTEVDLNVTNAPGAGEDNYVLTYNHAGTNFTWAVDADTGGSTAWDDIGNPDNSGLTTITFDNAELSLLTGDNDATASFFTIQNSDADHTGGNLYLLDLDYSADDGDADADFIKFQDSGSVVMTIQQNGDIATDGGLTAGGTVEGATITEGGVAVYNDNEIDEFSEINAIVADKTLVNEEDTVTWDAVITFSDAIILSDAANIDQSANNYIDLIENGDKFQFYFGGTDLDLIWSDGVFNIRNAENGVDAIVEIEGKDAGEKGVLRVLSDGDDKYIELYNDDTDAVLTNSAGNIIINPVGLGVVIGDNGDEDYTLTFDGDTSNGVLNYDEDNADFEFNQDIITTGDITATEFVGGGAGVTSVDAITGDSATAFFDAGTIEHEYGGLEADISGYTGLVAITGGSTAEVDSKSELEGHIADVADFAEADGDVYTGNADFGGADLELPQASPGAPDADGEIEVDFTDGSVVIQHGSAHAELGAATDVVVGKLIRSFGATLAMPDGLQSEIDNWQLKAIESTEFPHGIVITRIYLKTSASSTYAVNVENWDDPTTINGANPTIDAITTSGSTEVTENTITYSTIAAGQIIMLDLPTTDISWFAIQIEYYEPIS